MSRVAEGIQITGTLRSVPIMIINSAEPVITLSKRSIPEGFMANPHTKHSASQPEHQHALSSTA